MKKLKYLILFGSVLATGACKKTELDLNPYNQIETTQAFNTQSDITLAVTGMYAGLKTSGSYYVSGLWNILADVLADNVIIDQAGRLTNKLYGQYLYTSQSTFGLFQGGYTIVRRANAILENIDKFPAGAFHDNAKGEALAIRALVYFDMARVYSKTYLNASATDSTMPYVTSTDATITPAKENLKGFYDKVIADLVAAQGLIFPFGTDITISNPRGRLNKTAVAGLLSRVYLYKGDYANCITSANTALGATPVLPSIGKFAGIWTDATDSGVLFKVLNTVIDKINTQGVNYYQTVAGGIKSEYVVEYNFKQMFLPADIRTSTYILTAPYNGVNYNHIIKYAGRPGQPAGAVDGKALRTAEVILNRMEAYARTNNEPAANADLNWLKTSRYASFVPGAPLTGAALLNEILKERRLELAFEGDRFWDLKRLNLPVTRDGTKGDKADGTGVPYVVTSLPVGDFRFQLPFPINETSFNTHLTNNPGY